MEDMKIDPRINALKDAVEEAYRFIAKAQLAADDIDSRAFCFASKHHASAKRASMDLTNALVKVRHPYNV